MPRSPPRTVATDAIEELLEELLLPELDGSTLLCLDLDDVLLKTTQFVGSEAWESALVAELATMHGFPEPKARGTAGQLWRALHWVCESETPQAETARVVAALQQRAARVIGLTARDSVLVPLTVRQLADAGISFTGSSGSGGEAVGDTIDRELVKGARLSAGVIYCGDASKREALLSFMRDPLPASTAASPSPQLVLSYPPPLAQLTTVVHVDDKLSHLSDLAAAFGGAPPGAGNEGGLALEDEEDVALMISHLSFVGVHYTRVARDRSRAQQPVGSESAPSLDPGTVALALALASSEARIHLGNAVACADGDRRFFYAKH
jgi:hypothetical protein